MSEIDRILTNLEKSERVLPGDDYAELGETKIDGLDAHLFDYWWGYQFVVSVNLERWDIEDDHVEILIFDRIAAYSEPSIIASLKPNTLGMGGPTYSFEFSKELNKRKFLICSLSSKERNFHLVVDDYEKFVDKSSTRFYRKKKWDFKFS